ncbi:hypothetical protein GCM10027098_19740 [Bowmanella dokdonensis]|nr:transporter substrate-binding domain-containing protein [Bowmanella dokdonensis]
MASAADKPCDKLLRVHLDLHAPSAYLDGERILGMDAELVEAILTRAGCRIQWHTVPMTGARILKSLQDGRIDMMIRASKTPRRLQYAYFTRPYRQEVVGLFRRHTTELPSTLTLEQAWQTKLRLIGPASGWYGEEFERYRQQWQQTNLYTAYPDAAVATELLFAHPSRGELLWVDADIFYHFLGPGRRQKVRLLDNYLLNSPAMLMITKSSINSQDLQAINRAIFELSHQGKLSAIEERYRPPELRSLLEQASHKHSTADPDR